MMPNTTPWSNPLGKFLRAVREERGLSREDLCAEIQRITGHRLAAHHYARIEWGIRTPRADTLDKIAHGLGLSQAQREYAFSLIAERFQPPPGTPRAAVPDAVRRIVRLQETMSAHVVDRRLDLVVVSPIFGELWGIDLDAIDERDRNIAWLMFRHQNMKKRLQDWDVHAQTLVALCRSQWSGRKNDGEIRSILYRMMAIPEFAAWWDQPKVSAQYFRKEIRHPEVGSLVLEQTVHQVLTYPDLYMVLLAPLPECATEEKLRRLLTLHGQRRAE